MKTITKHSGRIEQKNGLRAIADMRATVKSAWNSACEHEQIPTDSKFVVFSDDNPFSPFYDKAVRQLMEMMEQYQAGGYIGLRLS